MEQALGVLVLCGVFFLMFGLPLIRGQRQMQKMKQRCEDLIRHFMARIADKRLSASLRQELMGNLLYMDIREEKLGIISRPLKASELDKLEDIIRSDPAFLLRGEFVYLGRIDELRLELISRMQA